MSLKYAVIGAGAVGGYFGGRLAYAGNDVHFLFNSDYNHVQQNGLKIDSVNDTYFLKHVNAYSSTSDMPQVDVVLVGLKTTNNHLIKVMLKPILKDDTLIILIQNGIGAEEVLQKELPDRRIAGGLAFICSEKTGPGYIKHIDHGSLTLASMNKDDDPTVKAVCADFENAGISCKFSDDLKTARWQKLVWNAPFNGMTVVLNTTTDAIMNNEGTRKLAYDIMQEVITGANACGAKLPNDFADKMMYSTLHMKPYATSMKVDFDNKRALEIDALYTKPISYAAECGFSMKKVEVLEKQLHFINEKNLSEG